jgi:hypothetical protein
VSLLKGATHRDLENLYPNSSRNQPGRFAIAGFGPPRRQSSTSSPEAATEHTLTTRPSRPRIGDPDIPPRIASAASVTQTETLPCALHPNQRFPSRASSQASSPFLNGPTEGKRGGLLHELLVGFTFVGQALGVRLAEHRNIAHGIDK